MATKEDFSDEEWTEMQKGVTGAGALVYLGDRDFTDSFGEASALAKYLASQRQANESSFIQELANTHRTGFGLTDSPEEVEAGTQGALRSTLETLAARAPEELDAYRQLVVGVMDAVAEAKGGVRPAESAVVDRIKETLSGA
jgi:septum formation inhibitor-activating ATPase MinD